MAHPRRRLLRTELGRAKQAAFSALGLAGSVALLGTAGCSVDNSNGITGGGDANYVVANGSEPQNPLIPTNTNEVGGSRIIDCLFAGLTYHDAEGKSHLETAESIDSNEDNTEYTVHLKETTFSDAPPSRHTPSSTHGTSRWKTPTSMRTSSNRSRAMKKAPSRWRGCRLSMTAPSASCLANP